jgi:hypothetical protein
VRDRVDVKFDEPLVGYRLPHNSHPTGRFGPTVV